MASFKNSYQYGWQDIDELTAIKLYQNAAEPLTVEFKTPRLFCYGCLSEGEKFSELFEMNVRTTIYREETRKVELLETGMYRYETVPNTRTIFTSFYSGATSIPDADNATYFARGGIAYLRRISENTCSDENNTKKAGSWSDYYTATSALARVVTGVNSKKISFTIPALTAVEIEAGKGYRFTIECVASPINANAMMSYYEAYQTGTLKFVPMGLFSINYYTWRIYTKSAALVDATSVKVGTSFNFQDFSIATSGGALITKGDKYSCYELLRKALLTCDTHLIDNNTTSLDEYDNFGVPQESLKHSIVLDDKWNNRLKTAKMHETIFEGKNLWEILLQIGYYVHAIPYLEFADDKTDADDSAEQFVLNFEQLGDTTRNDDKSNKITVFNSRNLSEFFTQYDSYVTNLFSPQNLVDEWVVPKTSDSSYLVSNNTAELQLSYAITEIVEFEISMKLPNGKWDTRPAIEYVFEKSIYDIISNDNPYKISPSKGAALYYTLGDSKIQGLNFVPPSPNGGDFPMALKRIVQIVWQGTEIKDVSKIRFNELKFHIKYRTQDMARITQVRPDLQNFMKNSSLEKYPHHEQYFGQQDKIIDSERFTANLFGKLIRVGNAVYQRQECADAESEKVSGQLVEINGDDYYITAIENEYYADVILQKVTYSKNFNQLSNIVTIPSEPRFYEVSERSKIRREVRIMEFFELSTTPPENTATPRFLNSNKWKEFMKNLIFKNVVRLPNYAFTRFKADKKRTHSVAYDELFPSSLLARETHNGGTNTVSPQPPADHSDCIVPVLHFPLHDGIVFAWDMADNFKAGDFVDDHKYSATYDKDDDDTAYLSMQPLRYVDVFGRADLMTFRLFDKTDWDFEEAQKLPRAIISVSDDDSIVHVPGGDNWGIAIDKDCREEMSFNYQINLLHRQTKTDKDDFFIFPNLFGQKESSLKVCLLSEPQSLFNENINISTADVLADDVNYEFYDASDEAIGIRFVPSETTDLSRVKAVVFYDENEQMSEPRNRSAYIVKNISSLTEDGKLPDWYIYAVYNS